MTGDVKVTFSAYDGPRWISGPNTWLRQLLPVLVKHGVEPEVVVLHSGDAADCPLLVWLRDFGWPHRFTQAPSCTEDRVLWLLRQLRERPPDVFVPNVSVAAHFAAGWARDAGIATIGVLHSDEDFYHEILEAFGVEDGPFRLSAVACVSSFLAAHAAERAPGLLVRQTPYGVPVPRGAVGPPDRIVRLVYVGRFIEYQKRILRVADWLCHAVNAVSGVEALLLGDGPEREAVERIVEERGARSRITVGHWLDSGGIQEQLRESHAIVLLSDFEGLPIALLEGMANGLVPISTRIRSGVPELVQDGVTGLLTGDDASSFVAAVTRLREDSGLWRTLSLNARSRIEAGYTIEAMASSWARLIEDVRDPARTRHPVRLSRRIRLPPLRPIFARDDYRRLSLARRVASKAKRCWHRLQSP